MKTFYSKLVLVILVQVVISNILVEAGFFDQFKKDKDKLKRDESDPAKHDQEQQATNQLPPRRGTNKRGDETDERANLIKKLSEQDSKPKSRKKPALNKMMASARQHLEEEQEELEAEPEPAPTKKINARDMVRRIKKEQDEEDQAPERGQEPERTHKGPRRPSVKPRVRVPSKSDSAKHPHLQTLSKNKVLHASFWKKQGMTAYSKTKDNLIKPLAETIVNLPEYMKDGYESISATLKLDSKGRLLAMIAEVEDDIKFVRREFSSFSITWSPIMEKSLSYIGREHLDKLHWKDKDEMDFRKDALNAAAFGYEFMLLMMAWRENLMFAHQAFKAYLESVKADFEEEKFEINEEYMYQLEAIHNYILLNSWMEIDNLSVENKMKLDYLMEIYDEKPKNYESEYFRHIILMQELYEPTNEEFKAERKQVLEALADVGNSDEENQFEDVDEFLQEFKEDLVNNNHGENGKDKIDWEVPEHLAEFMKSLRPELRYNQLIYPKSFLADLKDAKDTVIAEMYN